MKSRGLETQRREMNTTYTPQMKHLRLIVSLFLPTFVGAVSEGTGSADGARPFFQGVCAAAQWVTFAVEVEGVLSRDAVGATHAAAAWRQVVLVDVSRTHWDTHTQKKISRSVISQDTSKKKKPNKTRLTEVGVVVFSCICAGGSRRRQWGLAACVLKAPC